MYTKLTDYISKLNINSISTERKETLNELINYIQQKTNANADIRLNFICTHNSRRSHLSQIWAQTMANHFTIKNVVTYSAGTEATVVYPMVIQTLTDIGFTIEKLSTEANPVYAVKTGESTLPIIAFSKTIDSPFNPNSGFAAIMTCSHADENCPFVPGAEKRIPITYEDPKAFDNTDLQAEKYLERSTQIATEMAYVFSQINN